MAIVMKFGGTSVQDADRIRQAVRLVASAPETPLVVLSAQGQTTDRLFEAARLAVEGQPEAGRGVLAEVMRRHLQVVDELFGPEVPPGLCERLEAVGAEADTLLRGMALLREGTPRSLDALASAGERLSTLVFAACLDPRDPARPWVDARTVMETTADFGAAQPVFPAVKEKAASVLRPRLAAGETVVTQGYIGASADGLTTTLGRGGSDYSAALFGAALGASEVQIWTDVEGVQTCDPRLVPDARPIALLSFAEAGELAAFGARVLHPATIQPAVETGIPVTVRHTGRPDGDFTTILRQARCGRVVTALATRGPVTVLTVRSTRMLNQPGFLARVFEAFGRRRISVDLVATAEVSVSLTVEPDVPLAGLLGDLGAFSTVEVAEGRAIVAVVGERVKRTPGVASRAFSALEDINVEMVTMGANEINLSLVVRQEQALPALRRLHAGLIAPAPGRRRAS